MRWLDHAYVRIARPLGCFERGWGDLAALERPLDPAEPWGRDPPADLRWTRARVAGEARIVDAVFESPEERLPLESRTARVRWIAPRAGSSALAVALAPWSDEGFVVRQRMFAPIVASGVSLVILENAFYGARRRVAQRGSRLAYVSDFVTMGRATVRESHALFGWARAQGYERVGVVGYSMGGQLAAMSAALAPEPVRVVAMAPAVTPASVFLDGPLRRDIAWAALGADGVARLRRALTSLSVLGLPPVRAPHLATVVGTRKDAIVPPDDAIAIARHWRTSPRWLDEGHVSAALKPRALAQAVIDTFARLD